MVKTLGHWKTSLKVPDTFLGFIYRITNLANGRVYLGRKQCTVKTTKPPLKGKKRKRRGIQESDWKTYTGSNKALNADIQKLGLDCFRFEIIHFCQTKSDLAYWETFYILTENALLDKKYYNEYLFCRLRVRK